MDKRIAKTNFDYCQETINLKGDLELSYLDLASRLHKIQLNKMYEPNYESFDEFLWEIKLSKASASKLINIWVRFVIQFKIAPKLLAEAGGWSVVAEILPVAKSKSAAERWLRQAKANRRGDLRKTLKEKKSGVSMAKCPHKHKRNIFYWQCERCGDTGGIYAEELQREFFKWWNEKRTGQEINDWWIKKIGLKQIQNENEGASQ